MLFLILLSTSLGVWATIDMLSSDKKSDSSDEEPAIDQLTADEELESTDNYLQLGDKNNVVGYDASETENYVDMRGDDPNYEPVTITDFNRNEDTIEIGVFSWPLNAPIDQNRLDTQMDFDARQTLIYVDDDVVAKLDGLFVGIDDRITLTHRNSLGQHSLDQVTLGS